MTAPADPGTRGAEPVFNAPWEAHAFALAVSLSTRGLYTWAEWTAALATSIAAARERGDADSGDGYYQHWLGALETLLAAKGIAAGDELARYRLAWARAAARTPHGAPIELTAADW